MERAVRRRARLVKRRWWWLTLLLSLLLLFNPRLHLVQEASRVPLRRRASLLDLQGVDLFWRTPLTEEEKQRSVSGLDWASARGARAARATEPPAATAHA